MSFRTAKFREYDDDDGDEEGEGDAFDTAASRRFGVRPFSSSFGNDNERGPVYSGKRRRDAPKPNEIRRSRFHGAFTGGFTAGHDNTVGSAEGWKPIDSYSISRSRRRDGQDRGGGVMEQRPEDFMDEEDHDTLGRPVGVRGDYARRDDLMSGLDRKHQRATESLATTAIPGPIPKEFLDASVPDPVGRRLLQTMMSGSKRRRRYKRKKGGVLSEKHMDLPPPKNDSYGIGFDPYKNAPEFKAEAERRKRARAAASAAGGARNVYRTSDVADDDDENADRKGEHQQYVDVDIDGRGGRSVGGFALHDDEDDVYDASALGRNSAASERFKEEYHTEVFVPSDDSDVDHGGTIAPSKRKGVAAAAVSAEDEFAGALHAWTTGGGEQSSSAADTSTTAAEISKGREPQKVAFTSDGRPPLAGFVLGSVGVEKVRRWPGPDVPSDFRCDEDHPHIFSDDDSSDYNEDEVEGVGTGRERRRDERSLDIIRRVHDETSKATPATSAAAAVPGFPRPPPGLPPPPSLPPPPPPGHPPPPPRIPPPPPPGHPPPPPPPPPDQRGPGQQQPQKPLAGTTFVTLTAAMQDRFSTASSEAMVHEEAEQSRPFGLSTAKASSGKERLETETKPKVKPKRVTDLPRRREEFAWVPAALLCKRMGVRPPVMTRQPSSSTGGGAGATAVGLPPSFGPAKAASSGRPGGAGGAETAPAFGGGGKEHEYFHREIAPFVVDRTGDRLRADAPTGISTATAASVGAPPYTARTRPRRPRRWDNDGGGGPVMGVVGDDGRTARGDGGAVGVVAEEDASGGGGDDEAGMDDDRPPIDIFKSIFEPSDEESSSEESSSEESEASEPDTEALGLDAAPSAPLKDGGEKDEGGTGSASDDGRDADTAMRRLDGGDDVVRYTPRRRKESSAAVGRKKEEHPGDANANASERTMRDRDGSLERTDDDENGGAGARRRKLDRGRCGRSSRQSRSRSRSRSRSSSRSRSRSRDGKKKEKRGKSRRRKKRTREKEREESFSRRRRRRRGEVATSSSSGRRHHHRSSGGSRRRNDGRSSSRRRNEQSSSSDWERGGATRKSKGREGKERMRNASDGSHGNESDGRDSHRNGNVGR